MSRSIKKGPFVAPELYKRVEELNKTGEKKVLTWLVISWASSFPRERSAVIPAPRPPILSKEEKTWKRKLI